MSTAHPLQTGNVALVLSNRLGDSLYQMTLANNLRKAGRDITVYGVHGYALREWFPDFDIRPLPADSASLAGYDTIVQMDPDSPFDGLTRVCKRFLSTKEWGKIRAAPRRHDSPNGILDEFRRFSADAFGLTEWSADNGLRAPAGLTARRHDKRVILHPTSSEAERCWTPGKYVVVARRLRAMGYEPTFVLAPSERAFWKPLLEQAHAGLVEAPSIEGVAAEVYESGWFIGTDSGIGHLASCCGLSTVTIVDRPATCRAGARPGQTTSLSGRGGCRYVPCAANTGVKPPRWPRSCAASAAWCAGARNDCKNTRPVADAIGNQPCLL